MLTNSFWFVARGEASGVGSTRGTPLTALIAGSGVAYQSSGNGQGFRPAQSPTVEVGIEESPGGHGPFEGGDPIHQDRSDGVSAVRPSGRARRRPRLLDQLQVARSPRTATKLSFARYHRHRLYPAIVDAEALAADAESRGWIDEAERHRRLITRLDALLAEGENLAG